jgi:ribonuclease D
MLITDNYNLKQEVSKIMECDVIAIDTEFVREKTYYPKLSLIQIATRQTFFAVDALSDIDIKILKPLLQKKSIIKIFHSCKQDLEVLFNYFDVIPKNIFDTQIAAMLLGYNEPPSYETLITDFIGEKPDKKFQYSDWLQRPLLEDQLKYAYDDVILLLKAYPIILSKLDELNRLLWLKEECEALEAQTNFIATEEELLRKFVQQLDNQKQLFDCLKIIRLREQKAKNLNLNRARVLNDRNMITIIKFGGKPKDSKLSKSEIEEALNYANTEHDIKTVEKCQKLSKLRRSQKVETFLQLRKELHKVAENQKIAPSLIATSDEIVKFANGIKKNIRFLSGWRKNIFGNIALELIK